MFLDLHEIIEVPGKAVPFECELDREFLAFPALVEFKAPVTARGEVRNSAGILELKAEIFADILLTCDLCTAEYSQQKRIPVCVTLQADAPEEEDDTLFPLEGDGIDVSTVLETCFILDNDQRFLCRPDCRGLCAGCGKNLNDGPCDCREAIDPRLAVLGQLLDDTEN